MSDDRSNGKPNEQKLVKLYMDLAGAGESRARSVFMFVCPGKEPGDEAKSELSPGLSPIPEPDETQAGKKSQVPSFAVALLIGLSVTLRAYCAEATGKATDAGTRIPPDAAQLAPQRLSLADAINLALTQNADVLRARKDLEVAQGVAVQTRAIALPTVGINGSFAAVQRTDLDIFGAPGFTFGTPQNWSSQVKLVQNLSEGGRMLSAFRVGKLLKQESLLTYQTAVANTVLNVEIAYYDVLMAAQQITVQAASVELLTHELEDTTRRYNAGTVPRFNVLRAEVELGNARPRLINTRNSLRITKNNLANLVGFNVPRGTAEDVPLELSGELEAEPYEMELPHAVTLALEHRTELAALRKTEALRSEDVISAKAGYKPIVQGYVGYDVHNSMLSQDLSYEDHGWIAGVQLSWNLFDGLRTQGRIQEAAARRERAAIDIDDSARRIELEVRTAYSSFIDAREVLESQKKVQEAAEESLRLAGARSEAGTGTQLDVLSAQTALTEARTTQVQALHDYAAARARLQRAVGMNVPTEAIAR